MRYLFIYKIHTITNAQNCLKLTIILFRFLFNGFAKNHIVIVNLIVNIVVVVDKSLFGDFDIRWAWYMFVDMNIKCWNNMFIWD